MWKMRIILRRSARESKYLLKVDAKCAVDARGVH